MFVTTAAARIAGGERPGDAELGAAFHSNCELVLSSPSSSVAFFKRALPPFDTFSRSISPATFSSPCTSPAFLVPAGHRFTGKPRASHSRATTALVSCPPFSTSVAPSRFQ
jgi:hypothetical protein